MKQKAVDLCKNVGDIGEIAKKLVKFAIENCSRDNVSVMILQFNWFHNSMAKWMYSFMQLNIIKINTSPSKNDYSKIGQVFELVLNIRELCYNLYILY